MFAPSPNQQTESSINILFGQKINTQKTPIFIDLTFDIFSNQIQSEKFVLQILAGSTIDENTLFLELLAKNGNGSSLADKIMTFLKTNSSYLQLNKEGSLEIKALGQGQSCYVYITSQKFSNFINKITDECSELSQQKSEDPNIKHQIKLEIKSNNKCSVIQKLLDNQGGIRAIFDSLALNFTFNKTKLVQNVLEKIFHTFQMQPIISSLKGFNKLNLSLKFASASEMDKYEKLRVFGKVINKVETFFISSIKGEIKEEINFKYFNGTFSFWGQVVAEQLQNLLNSLFEQPQKEK